MGKLLAANARDDEKLPRFFQHCFRYSRKQLDRVTLLGSFRPVLWRPMKTPRIYPKRPSCHLLWIKNMHQGVIKLRNNNTQNCYVVDSNHTFCQVCSVAIIYNQNLFCFCEEKNKKNPKKSTF